jgi:hypothetical protein
MKTVEFVKIVMFLVSLILTLITVDDTIDNIITASKDEYNILTRQIFPVGLSIITAIFWSGFYALSIWY